MNEEIVKNDECDVDDVIDGMAKQLPIKSDIKVEYFEEAEDVPDPRDLSKDDKNLLIFDDLILSKQNKIEDYYTRGRHSNVDCIYLSQNYFKLPRQTIRENANLFILFPQDLKNINHIYNDHVSEDMEKEEFRSLCRSAWRGSHTFLTIDLSSPPESGRRMEQEQVKVLLKRLVKNTSPKQETQVLLTGDSSNFMTNFNPPLKLDDDREYSIALVNLETYYSFPNVEEGVNNRFRYSPDNGLNYYEIEIDTGSYEITDLNNVIFQKMKLNGHFDTVNDTPYVNIYPNENTLKVIMELSSGYVVDFTPDDSLRELLGFEATTYNTQTNESTNPVQIIPVNSILINVDVVEGSYVSGTPKPIIYSFFPNVGPGFKIIEVPRNLVYLRMNRKQIANMRVRITDQNDKLLNLRGENITIRLHIKEL
ncbi:hypothetical protein ACROYT_G024059 [Oculina patagonica]